MTKAMCSFRSSFHLRRPVDDVLPVTSFANLLSLNFFRAAARFQVVRLCQDAQRHCANEPEVRPPKTRLLLSESRVSPCGPVGQACREQCLGNPPPSAGPAEHRMLLGRWAYLPVKVRAPDRQSPFLLVLAILAGIAAHAAPTPMQVPHQHLVCHVLLRT